MRLFAKNAKRTIKQNKIRTDLHGVEDKKNLCLIRNPYLIFST